MRLSYRTKPPIFPGPNEISTTSTRNTKRRLHRSPKAHRNGKMATYQNGAAPARALDDSDVEEEALVADYQEQVQYEDGMEELEQVNSLTMAQQTDDIQSRLAAAAQPLDFAAPLEVKFQSYDSYCSLFHFILNSDGPVDLEPPSVSEHGPTIRCKDATRMQMLTFAHSTIGPGTSSTSSSTSSTPSPPTVCELQDKRTMRRKSRSCATTQTLGAATVFSTFCTR